VRVHVITPSYRREVLATMGVTLVAAVVSVLWNGLWTLPIFLAGAGLAIYGARKTRKARLFERFVYEQIAPLELPKEAGGFRHLPAEASEQVGALPPGKSDGAG